MPDARTGPIVVIGDALIDEIRDEYGSREFVGGAALNVAVGLSVLGRRTTLIAMVGDDVDGDAIRVFLGSHSVELVATRAPNGTARAVSDRTDGEPRYVFNRASIEREIEFDDATRAALDVAPLVVVSCYPFDSDEKTDALLAAVDDAPTRLVVDPNPRPGMMRDLAAFVRNVDRIAATARLVKIGDEDSALLYDSELDPAAVRLQRDGAAFVLATAGRRGADLLTPDGPTHAAVATLPGPIVDTMGAGDATLAAVTDSLRRADVQGTGDLDFWRGALDNAMVIAAATCRSEGALLQLP
jgi:fructokinase